MAVVFFFATGLCVYLQKIAGWMPIRKLQPVVFIEWDQAKVVGVTERMYAISF